MLPEQPFTRVSEITPGDIGVTDRPATIYTGTVLFLLGIGLGITSLGVFLYSTNLPVGNPAIFAVREVAVVTGGIALPALLLSIGILFAPGPRVHYAGGIGGLACAMALGVFVWAYPAQWNGLVGVDYAVVGIAIYGIGLVVIAAGTAAAVFTHHIRLLRNPASTDGTQAAGSVPDRQTLDRPIDREEPETNADGMLSVLLVDDDSEFRRLMKHRLEAEGFWVQTAENAFACLEQLRTTDPPPDAVLLDLSMPGMDGFETLRRIRQINTNLPVFVVSGIQEDTKQIRAFDLGAVDFISKPININLLTVRIKRLLNHRPNTEPARPSTTNGSIGDAPASDATGFIFEDPSQP